MKAIIKRLAFYASLLAITVTTGCAAVSIDGDGAAVTSGTHDVLAAMATASEAGGD